MAPENPTTPVEPPAEFYVLKNGETFGPFHEEQLRKGVAEGHFAPEDLVRIEGQEDWRPISSILPADETDLRGAVAPDWNCILRWIWLRFRYNLGEQSLATGAACLGIGILALALSRWPFVFWLPWFGAAVVCAIPLLRRKQEVHGTLLLVGVVCIPILFAILGQKHRSHESPGGGDTDLPLPAPQAVAESQPPFFPAAPPGNPQAPGSDPAAASLSPVSQPSSNNSAPEPITPHYATLPPANAPGSVLPSNPAVEKINPPPPASEPAPEVDFAHEHGDALVIVKGAEGSGSGFICATANSAVLFTNTHVIADLTDITVTRMDGAVVSPGDAEVAAGRDIARIAILSPPPAHPLEIISDFNNNVHIGDDVVVLGKSGDGGVVAKIDGKIAGIGPDRIEVSAELIPGNSGSPIIHVKTGLVIGIATYLPKPYEEFASNNNKDKDGAVVVRRFGYRIDNVPAWERVDWSVFLSDAEQMRQISALTGDIFDFLGSLRAKQEPKFATDTLRRPATEWLASLQNKHVSDFDRQSATRGFLNSLHSMVRNDVTAAGPHLRYTYFQEELKAESRVRDLLYKSFDEESAKLSTPSNHPTSIRKAQ